MSTRAESAVQVADLRWLTTLTCQAARRLLQARLATMQGVSLRVADSLGGFFVGTGPELELDVHDLRFYPRVLLGGDIGAGGAYIDGYWDTADLTRLFLALLGETTTRLDKGLAGFANLYYRLRHRLNANTPTGSARNIGAHYDLGNDFFAAFLDATMTYSAAIFEPSDCSIDKAATVKMDKACRLLDLQPADRLLEIGSGWGGFAVHAATRYGCHVTAVTISRAQYEYTSRRISELGLEGRVEVVRSDYRQLRGRYDKLASIEMLEAVGHRYLPEYFLACERLLRPGGRMFLQTIVMPDRGYDAYLKTSDYIRHYIFPGSNLPSIGSILNAISCNTSLGVHYLEDIGLHYARTLAAWDERLLAAGEHVRRLGYPESLLRAWHYYFCYCRAGFLKRHISDVQVLLESRS